MSLIESVSSVANSATTTASAKKNKAAELSASTKSKLEALGIDSSQVTSEAQAQVLIAQKNAEKAQESSATKNESQSNTSETEVLSEAKSLANTLSVKVSDDDTVDEIISNIQAKITELMAEPGNRQMAMAYQQQLDLISSQNNQSTTDMYSALNQVAANNKYSMNIS